MRSYYVYVLANHSRRLYTGITSDLVRRVFQHRAGGIGAYTRDFRITRLMYFECYRDVNVAIAREKQLKRWPRERKIQLIERRNAGWRDLAIDWFPDARQHLRHDAPGES